MAATVAVVGLIGAAFPDFLHWRTHVTQEGYVAFDTPQLTAAVAGAVRRWAPDDGLVLAGPCIDPLLLKPAWTGRVAHFNRGLAWPDTPAPLYVLGRGIGYGFLDPELARASGVRWVLTDTGCATGLMPSPLTLVDSVDYRGPTATDPTATAPSSSGRWTRLAGPGGGDPGEPAEGRVRRLRHHGEGGQGLFQLPGDLVLDDLRRSRTRRSAR